MAASDRIDGGTSVWGRALLVVAVIATACQKSSAPSSAPEAAATGAVAGDDLASVRAELVGNAAELQALGVVIAPGDRKSRDFDDGDLKKEKGDERPRAEPIVEQDEDTATKNTKAPTVSPQKPADAPSPETPSAPPPPPTKAAGASVSTDACGRICSLAGAACELSQRICTLADQHDGDARYEDLCWNAQRQCEAASDACADCSTC